MNEIPDAPCPPDSGTVRWVGDGCGVSPSRRRVKGTLGFRILAVVGLGLVLGTGWSLAQWRYGRGWESSATGNERTAREMESHSTGTPVWTNAPGFTHDVFTFARIVYDSGGWGGRGGWSTDAPDSDLNFSYRLQQMTSMKVDPDGRILRLTDPELYQYPFIYIVEPGGVAFSDAEAAALRSYLLNGGFLMFDDFWGEREWANCEAKMKQVFPDRSFEELSLDHPLYHCVFDIQSKGQVPNVHTGVQSQYTGVTWERPDAREVHHRGISDDKGRLMVMATHNTDNGDGWEREGEDDYYFHNFSEKISYPLGINIVFYVMTH
ncbi:MAG: hypothetical protein RIS76_2916 [Verrucomicrobiota bacterium]